MIRSPELSLWKAVEKGGQNYSTEKIIHKESPPNESVEIEKKLRVG